LPPISNGEAFYCQGWSEPDAGSDLASLTTTAVKDHGHTKNLIRIHKERLKWLKKQ